MLHRPISYFCINFVSDPTILYHVQTIRRVYTFDDVVIRTKFTSVVGSVRKVKVNIVVYLFCLMSGQNSSYLQPGFTVSSISQILYNTTTVCKKSNLTVNSLRLPNFFKVQKQILQAFVWFSARSVLNIQPMPVCHISNERKQISDQISDLLFLSRVMPFEL